MPRLPKFTHPLRLIRQCAGLSQPAFARKVGVSASAIQAIELGKRGGKSGLSPRLAVRVSAVFGVKLGTFERMGLRPRDLTGQPYSTASLTFIDCVAELEEVSGREAYRRKQITVLVDLMLQAASTMHRFEACRWSLVSWVVEAMRDFGLRYALRNAYESRTTIDQALKAQHAKRQKQLRALIDGKHVSMREARAFVAKLPTLEKEYETDFFLREPFDEMLRSVLSRRRFSNLRWT